MSNTLNVLIKKLTQTKFITYFVMLVIVTHHPVFSELTIVPRPELAVNPAATVSFDCSGQSGNQTIQWLLPDGKKVPENTTVRIHQQNNTLNIVNATYNDTGIYVCQTSDRKHNMTADLKVFDMPTYFTEGMIIVGINAALILLFIGCGIYSLINSRRTKQTKKQVKYKKSVQMESV